MLHKCFKFLLILFSVSVLGQTDDEPVIWTHSWEKLNENEYSLTMKGAIAEGWHVYSQFTSENGSLPSVLEFYKAGEDYELLGPTEESETVVEYSDIFEVDETFFKETAEFRQKIRLLKEDVTSVRVLLSYQVCKEVCIQVDREFVFALNGEEAVMPVLEQDEQSAALASALVLDLKNKEALNTGSKAEDDKQTSLWMIFGLGFLGGLIALLTPCVFPMIPLTVSFFTKHSGTRSKGIANALLYGFSIVLIYVLLSIPFHVFDSVDSQILNSIATNSWLNIFFFVVFLFFAFSFFGYYELTLPSSWANRMDAMSARVGGGLGVFFMALTLAIVSFSCTGPILGGLLGSTALAEGDVATNLSMGMFGFGLALALPFALFALFPAWLNGLPQSGGWMENVKVVLGFIELALAFKFLSNADLVEHWGILKREVFLGIWILLFAGMTLYLFGLLKVNKKAGRGKLSTTRKGFGVLSLLFTLYLILGTAGIIPMKLLSGFPPPDFYSLVNSESECPLGLDCYKDFETGLTVAREANKPILLDFTGWACVNCRKMEENVWSDPEVYRLLNEEFVLISLYTDDRQQLAEEDQFVFKFPNGNTKQIKTVGQRWGTFQNVNFGAVSQPYYVQLSPDLKVLGNAVQNTGIKEYRTWLEGGLSHFREASVMLP